MSIDEQKEAAAKAICLYVADQIEGNKLKMLDAAKLIRFLISGMEGAGTSDELKQLPEEAKLLWPELPAISLGF